MGRTRVFRVINNRMAFRCSSCGTKRNMPVPHNLRVKSVRCHTCKEMTKCQFNRRVKPREHKSGKVVLVTSVGEELLVDLNDISNGGVGISIPPGFALASKIKLGHKVHFKSSWNIPFIDNWHYMIRNISGRRVGLEKILLS